MSPHSYSEKSRWRCVVTKKRPLVVYFLAKELPKHHFFMSASFCKKDLTACEKNIALCGSGGAGILNLLSDTVEI